jgi:hypothetical protein
LAKALLEIAIAFRATRFLPSLVVGYAGIETELRKIASLAVTKSCIAFDFSWLAALAFGIHKNKTTQKGARACWINQLPRSKN